MSNELIMLEDIHVLENGELVEKKNCLSRFRFIFSLNSREERIKIKPVPTLRRVEKLEIQATGCWKKMERPVGKIPIFYLKLSDKPAFSGIYIL